MFLFYRDRLLLALWIPASTFTRKHYTSVKQSFPVFVGCHLTSACVSLLNVLCSIFHVKGVQSHLLCRVPLKLHALCIHTTMLSPQKHYQNYIASFSGVSPKGDYYVTSGSALQSFHDCNCTVSLQTLFSAFQRQF